MWPAVCWSSVSMKGDVASLVHSAMLAPSKTGEELNDAIEVCVTLYGSLSLTHILIVFTATEPISILNWMCVWESDPACFSVPVHLNIFAKDRGPVLKKERFCVSLYAFVCFQATEFVYPSGCELCRVWTITCKKPDESQTRYTHTHMVRARHCGKRCPETAGHQQSQLYIGTNHFHNIA